MRWSKCITIFTEMDQCVVCALKDFIREGPITAEPLCQYFICLAFGCLVKY
jgi:hypothetical protein